MRQRLLILLLSIFSVFTIKAQLLATPEDAEKAVKVVMISSSCEISSSSGVILESSHEPVEITLFQESKDLYSVSVTGSNNFQYEITTKKYRKACELKALENHVAIFNIEDTVSTPKLYYNSNIGKSGCINCFFSIMNPQNLKTYTYKIEKVLFVDKKGLVHNCYCERINTLENDLLNSYFKKIKIKDEMNFFQKAKKKVKQTFKKDKK